MSGIIIAVFVFIIVLLALAGVTFSLVMNSMSRKQKFETRISDATSDNQKPTIIMGDQISLAKVVSRTDLVKSQAANVIGVDLEQADAYPVKWWLVPPLSLGVSWVIVWLAAKSIGFESLMFVVGWPIAWFVVT
ncbi:MAG: hypothetical protein B7Y73_03375, partial [Acidocella sp. 35-58-6]